MLHPAKEKCQRPMILSVTSDGTLPKQLQAELHLSPDRLCAAQFPERRVADRQLRGARAGQIEGRRVRQVERLGAELQPLVFGQRDVLEQGKVEIPRSWPAKHVASGVAELADWRAQYIRRGTRHCERLRIEILIEA